MGKFNREYIQKTQLKQRECFARSIEAKRRKMGEVICEPPQPEVPDWELYDEFGRRLLREKIDIYQIIAKIAHNGSSVPDMVNDWELGDGVHDERYEILNMDDYGQDDYDYSRDSYQNDFECFAEQFLYAGVMMAFLTRGDKDF